MRKIISKFLALFFVAFISLTPVYAMDIPDSIDGYILDDANVLSSDTEDYISEKNWNMDQYCGGYVEIVTEKYINADIADYSYKLFNEWEIGGSEYNNGILLVLATEEGKYYLTYGRGIEKKVDSYVFDEILDEYFEEDFDAGNYDTAVKNTFDALYDELCDLYGTPSSSSYYSSNNQSFVGSLLRNIGNMIMNVFIFIVVFIFILFFMLRPRGPRGPGFYGGGFYGRRPPRSPYGGPGPMGGSGGHRSSGGSHRSSGGSHHSGGSFGGRSHGGSSRGAGVGRR